MALTSVPVRHGRGMAAAHRLLLACACLCAGVATQARAPVVAVPPAASTSPAPLNLARFEKDIVAFETADRTSPPPPGAILFVGSSIFRQWTDLQTQMAPLPVFNRAFGGSRTAEQLHFFDRIVLPYRPRVIVYYCGSNDINAHATAETIAGNYETFSERVRVALPGTRVYFASIIKAPQKRDRWDVVEAANARVRAYSARTPHRGYIDLHPALEDAPGQPREDLYRPDRLHYLPAAYERMAAVVRPVIAQAWAEVANASVPALAVPAVSRVELFRDDFSKFPPGWLSKPVGLLNGAIQEYHYLPHRGVPTHPWFNPITHNDSWVAGDEDGTTYVEQHLLHDQPERWQPLFVTGDPLWTSYTVTAKVRPLSLAESAGVVFRYHTNHHYYAFTITGGHTARLALKLPIEQTIRVVDWKILGTADVKYDVRQFHELKVENEGPTIRAYVDGRLVIEASDSDILSGRAGITANIPARFTDFVVDATGPVAQQIQTRVAARDRELAALRAANPQPTLWKKFATPTWGAGRNVRFGDLNGDGRVDMLFAQNIPKVRGDAFDHISCLTAVDLDGRILWQIGRPDPRNTLLTNDTPFQIHDIDGDGRNEVVMIKDFQIQVLEGATGKVRQRQWMPPAPAANRERPYELNSGDSMIFLNLSGRKSPQELLLKDRYNSFWVFDNALNLLWSGNGQTGHYPYPYDVDGDGKDEFVIGFAMWSAAGSPVWSHDAAMKDHTDAISIGNFTGNPQAPARVYSCGSDEGLVVIGVDGTLFKQVRIGHAQTQSVARYRPDVAGLQIMTANFWRNTGIVTLFDADANILAQEELIPGSSHLQPVNWRGDGQEFALLGANVREGGMVDGQLRRVVMLPDDGHPDLASQVLNVTGDQRDEIIVWDAEAVWIYTQDRPFTGPRMYRPSRNPLHNDSNYRATVSLPGWK